jgi:hypothetical protein
LVLGGSASDDGLPELPGQLSVAWTQITGACGVVFADASQAITTATFPVPGTYTLQLVADDGIATSADERTIELSAEPIENRPPVAIDDTGNTNEESTVTLAVAANDTDPDSNLNSASTNTNCATCTLPDNGTLVNNGNGSIDYTPTSGFVGDDSFVYEICDTELLCDTATATITVTGTSNTLPAVAITAPVDGATVTEGTVLTFTGTASDAEDGDITGALSWSSSLDGPLSGSGGSVMATLSVGTHTITASVTDAGGLSGSAAITVMVSLQGNNAPVVTITAPADGSSVTEGTVVTFTGMASDVEDSGLTTGISWSSSLDGPLQGSGGSVMATLSAGTHSITASVTDSGGLPGSDAITVDVFPDGGLQQTLDIRVAAGADDAEEISSGRTSLTSSDLELVFDREDQTVGLRFNGIAIPPGALITEAYIQFTVDEVDSEATSLTIEGEASSNAAPFTKTVFDISSRARTVANAAWVPAPWTAVGEADTAQRTTDLSGIVSQIINAQGWASGNSLAFIISGSGKRVAESFNGDAANAPLLHVSFFNSGGNAFPSLNITAPTDGTVVSEGTELTFSASASDIEDGDVSASTTWTSSLDGALPGSGSGITATLSVGTHVITANAVDSTGQPASDMISVIVTPAGGTLQTLDIQINTGADDAEEKATGSVSLSSSDLELIFDKTDQTVGLRFSNVTIEPGAVIVDAWVQFTVDEASSGGTELLLQGEASPDAQGFTNSTNNISSRPRTNAQVDWSPVPWQTVGVAGPDQRTPNLAGIISEIINGGGWSSGNALALVVTGSGERVAESANGQPGGAPILHINYVSSGTN